MLKRRSFLKSMTVGALAASVGIPAFAKAAKKPNLIFVMADDMGFGDPECNNPESKVPTPNMNRLAREGMRFTDAHTPSAVCTPTRYGVVTGRYCWRSRLKRGVLNGYSEHLINTDRLTIAGMLKKQGYHTAVIGKWHLGMDWQKKDDKPKEVDFTKKVKNGANTLGFDYSLLVPASLDMPPYVLVENEKAIEVPQVEQSAQPFPRYVRKGVRGENFVMDACLDKLTSEVCSHIEKQAKQDKPFFLYFPMTAPHKPAWPHPRFKGKTEIGDYGDFVAQVDWTLGQVLKALDKQGVAEDTLIVYSSDNGSYMFRYDEADAKDHADDSSIQGYRADRHRANYVFRGTKADVWEAGHRVPFLVRWPGKVKPKTTCDETICLTDMMATFGEVAGATLTNDAAEDSYSFLPLALGGKWEEPRPPVINHSVRGMFAIRDGKWKLVLGTGSGGRQNPRGEIFGKPYMLFDLKADIEESTDLAAKYPERVAKMTAMFEKIQKGGRSVVR